MSRFTDQLINVYELLQSLSDKHLYKYFLLSLNGEYVFRGI